MDKIRNKNDRHKDEKYYENYNRKCSKIILTCECGKLVKKSCMYSHLKTRIHNLQLELEKYRKNITTV